MKKLVLAIVMTLCMATLGHAAKTTFVDGNKATGVKGTVVNAAFLNAVNNHRHDGAAADGSGVLDYYVDSGSANAIIITPSPALGGHVSGLQILVKTAAANTGAATVKVGTATPVSLKRIDGAALQGGEYAAGSMVTVAYDGTYYRLIDPTPAASSNQTSTAVARDASGNFSAGTITATLNGSANKLGGKSWVTVAEGTWTGTINAGSEVLADSLRPTASEHRNYRVSIYSPSTGVISQSSGGDVSSGTLGYRIYRWSSLSSDYFLLTNSMNFNVTTTVYYKVDIWE